MSTTKIATFKSTTNVLGTVVFESETAVLVEKGATKRLFFKDEVDLHGLTCEAHDEPGECDEECYHLQCLMTESCAYDEMPYDPTGCRTPRPTSYPEVTFDPEIKAVITVYTHPEDCQCSDPDCPTFALEALYGN